MGLYPTKLDRPRPCPWMRQQWKPMRHSPHTYCRGKGIILQGSSCEDPETWLEEHERTAAFKQLGHKWQAALRVLRVGWQRYVLEQRLLLDQLIKVCVPSDIFLDLRHWQSLSITWTPLTPLSKRKSQHVLKKKLFQCGWGGPSSEAPLATAARQALLRVASRLTGARAAGHASHDYVCKCGNISGPPE